MFLRKKELKQKIMELEQDLEYERAVNKAAESSGLAKCYGVVCKSCEHAIYIREGYDNHIRLIGCDTTVTCKDYKRKTILESCPNALPGMQ